MQVPVTINYKNLHFTVNKACFYSKQDYKAFLNFNYKVIL